MPWRIERRDGRYCVVKSDDGDVEGCHDSRAQAIKQQRALYAQESRTASLYEELDAVVVPEALVVPDLEEPPDSPKSELVKIEIGQDTGALTASLFSQMERMNERQQRSDEALIAALEALGSREVSMPAPNITVEPAVIPAPEVRIDPPQVTVQAPQVTINPEFVLPTSKRTVTVKRGPDGRMTGAEVEERLE
jgi:hypothetical protein